MAKLKIIFKERIQLLQSRFEEKLSNEISKIKHTLDNLKNDKRTRIKKETIGADVLSSYMSPQLTSRLSNTEDKLVDVTTKVTSLQESVKSIGTSLSNAQQ